jgi:hypothetical protein
MRFLPTYDTRPNSLGRVVLVAGGVAGTRAARPGKPDGLFQARAVPDSRSPSVASAVPRLFWVVAHCLMRATVEQPLGRGTDEDRLGRFFDDIRTGGRNP